MKSTHLRQIRRARPAAAELATPLSPRARLPGGAFCLAGQVRDGRSGAPVAGARASLAEPVDLLFRLAPPPPARGRRGLCDAEGRFELTAPGDAPAWLLVHHPDYLPELVEVRPGSRRLDVALQRPGAIRGRLLDAGGRPLRGVLVRALCPAAVDLAEGRTGADGSFLLEGLRPGQWLVGPEGPAAGGVPAAVIELGAGETAEAELRHGPTAPEPVC